MVKVIFHAVEVVLILFILKKFELFWDIWILLVRSKYYLAESKSSIHIQQDTVFVSLSF